MFEKMKRVAPFSPLIATAFVPLTDFLCRRGRFWVACVVSGRTINFSNYDIGGPPNHDILWLGPLGTTACVLKLKNFKINDRVSEV